MALKGTTVCSQYVMLFFSESIDGKSPTFRNRVENLPLFAAECFSTPSTANPTRLKRIRLLKKYYTIRDYQYEALPEIFLTNLSGRAES